MKAMKKIASVVLSLLMVVSIIGVMPTQTDAAIKVLTGKKTTISIGESYGIATLAKGVKYSTSNSKVASVNSKGSKLNYHQVPEQQQLRLLLHQLR